MSDQHADDCAAWHGWPNPCDCGAGGERPAPVEVTVEVPGA